MRRWLLLASVALTASAFTVHQHSQQEHCLELQCPATAFEYGIRNLVSEETLRSDRCQACQQCTASGYSICLKMSESRGRRGSQTEGCSCTHSVPANCHSELSRQPPNMTMSAFRICYLSALQAPPRPLAVNNKESVIVTVEPFWTEPYWRDLQMENLTLHYEFAVQKPEHCEGELVTNEGERTEHFCKDSLELKMEGPLDGEAKQDEDYEHSDDYKEYDDSLPPEVAFDRDVFDGAKLLKAHYSVQVRRPRQLASASSDPFRDEITVLDSEVLKFDLKPEVYGTGIPELPPAGPVPTERKGEDVLPVTDAPKEDEEDVSEEHGEGTNFFEEEAAKEREEADDEKETKSEEEQEKEDAELEKKIGQMEASSTTETAIKEEEKEEEKEEGKEKLEEKAEVKEKSAEEEKEHVVEEEDDGKKDSHQVDKDQHDDVKEEVASVEKEEEEEVSTKAEEEDSATEEDKEKEEAEEEKSQEKDDDLENDDDEDEAPEGHEGGGQPKSSTEKTITIFGRSFTKWPLARMVFLVCLCSFLLIVSLWCCKKCCCRGPEEKTTANGYRYSNPNGAAGRSDLVCPPEKERLRQ